MKHVHADLMMEYAKDAQETDKPWERWEHMSETNGCSWIALCTHPKWYANWEYRRIDPYRIKPKAEDIVDEITSSLMDYLKERPEKLKEVAREFGLLPPKRKSKLVEITTDNCSEVTGVRLRYPCGGGQLINADYMKKYPADVAEWIDSWAQEWIDYTAIEVEA